MSEEYYEDKVLTCKDCKSEFTFEAGEQRFYEQMGYKEPCRCPDCRKKKKLQRENNERFGPDKKPAFKEHYDDPFRSRRRY